MDIGVMVILIFVSKWKHINVSSVLRKLSSFLLDLLFEVDSCSGCFAG